MPRQGADIPATTEPTTTTIPPDAPESRAERILRIAAFTFIFGMLLLAGSSLLGVRSGTVVAEGSGYSVEVLRAQVTRPGLATPFAVEISSTDGSPLPATVTLRLATAYMAIFDFNGLEPTPSASFSTDEWTWWEFEVPPDQPTLRVAADARLEPSVQWARSGSAALEVDGESLVSVDFTTWVMP